MAGRARTTALKDELQRLTVDYFDIDPVDVAIGAQSMPSHLDYICAKIESGTSLTRQATALGESLGFDVSYERIMAYLREDHGKEAVASALREARSRASHCKAEEAQDIVDEPATDSVGVQRARNRAHSRQWLAARYNPQEFGQEKSVNVAVSITSLHLAALQSVTNIVTDGAQQPSIGSGEVRALPTQVVDAQQVSDK